jgi:acylphosphatase
MCRYYLVSGRVQGVFFRASTRETARELGIAGWVRNTSDGKVELLACGSEQQLRELERWLRQGPDNARVDELLIRDTGEQSGEGFDIRY